MNFRKRAIILADDEPDPFEIFNPHGKAKALITCDHASNRIPESLGTLGLSEQQLGLHIAYDIGCYQVARQLSERLDAPLIMGNYSRLVIDLNRHLADPTSIAEVSDDHEISGNQGLTRQAAQQRIEEIFIPYHAALETLLDHQRSEEQAPVIIAIHSFTPVFQGFERPWHYGILWDRNNHLAAPLIEKLSRNKDRCVGENKPYHAREPIGYTMDVHAEGKGYAHSLIEIRQDLIEQIDGQDQIAEELGTALAEILTEPSTYQQQD